MNPRTYANLYGPNRPAQRRRGGRNLVAALTTLVWAVTFASLAWLTCLVGMAAVWGAAAGIPVGDVLLRVALIVTGAAGALTALAFAPGIRQWSAASRLLLVGALACPPLTGLAIWTWFQTG
jgi:hypothetical protein